MTMKAVRFTVPGAPPVVETVPIPTPGPGQVLVRIGARVFTARLPSAMKTPAGWRHSEPA